MTLNRRRLLLMPLATTAGAARAGEPAPLHVLVDGSTEMPQALIQDGRVVEGLQYDIALEIGRRTGRVVNFHLVPRRRVAQMLLAGEQADLICNYKPAWLPGPLQWSRNFLEGGELLVTASRHSAPRRLEDLAGQRIGTIAGFIYPELEAALGTGFLRDDAPNLASSLKKLATGRMDHAIVVRSNFDYLRKRGEVTVDLHPPLIVSRLHTGCALSPRSSLTLAQLDDALAALQADGSLTRILDRYR
jgi:ABC-type amino acid transport substrate-binding protein